ncbi:putative Spliceosome RNA helicase DDX39B [Hypsibius exemplaris]|uniref:Spliceosome RNA helicase DDX39B n=1 Tax=Hypsibius exemplaris TaxID=2072580 RepID=A0A1W0X148_HYPEX|nr:putative Spliceosome RNA helicase DDX39B [Hypsibius exemplaris]
MAAETEELLDYEYVDEDAFATTGAEIAQLDDMMGGGSRKYRGELSEYRGGNSRSNFQCAKSLDFHHVKHFVLDECNKGVGLDMRKDIQALLLKQTPEQKQVMMISVYFAVEDPLELIIDYDAKLTLHRLQQHYLKLKCSDKNQQLCELLDIIDFSQAIIFRKSVQRCIDVERVNIVINYECPFDLDTYLHRVARAGRFGSKGLAITFIGDNEDSEILKQVQSRFHFDITDLLDELDVVGFSR